MTPPRGLLGVTLAFWGWQADFLIAAVPAALAIEIAAFLSFRFDFELKDFRRIASLCLALVAGLALYTRLEAGSPHAAVQTVKLLPLAALPLILAQVYSTTSALRFDTLLRLGAEDKPLSGDAGAHFGFHTSRSACSRPRSPSSVRSRRTSAAARTVCSSRSVWHPRRSPISPPRKAAFEIIPTK